MIGSLRFSLSAGALAMLGVSLAAASILAAEPANKVHIRGEITSVTPFDDKAKPILGSIRVEGAKEKDTDYDKASVRITKDTKIEIVTGKESKPGKFEDLQKGVKVECVFTGPVAESYPVQATAKSVSILKK